MRMKKLPSLLSRKQSPIVPVHGSEGTQRQVVFGTSHLSVRQKAASKCKSIISVILKTYSWLIGEEIKWAMWPRNTYFP